VALWDHLDGPVLRWVYGLPSILEQDVMYELATRHPVDSDEIAGVRSNEVHDALVRLCDHELIAGECSLRPGGADWYALRVTAGGLVVLGDWPDVDRVASVSSLQLLLQQFAADSEDDDERTLLRRAAGAIGRIGAELVKGTWTNVASGVGRELSAESGSTSPTKWDRAS
jgi:hypothetical protein